MTGLETIILAIFGASVVAGLGPNENPTAFSECDLIDRGGYYVFADPSCAARFNEPGDEQGLVEETQGDEAPALAQ